MLLMCIGMERFGVAVSSLNVMISVSLKVIPKRQNFPFAFYFVQLNVKYYCYMNHA